MKSILYIYLQKFNCKIGDHRFVYGAFSYNSTTELYYPHTAICRDCGNIEDVCENFEVGI